VFCPEPVTGAHSWSRRNWSSQEHDGSVVRLAGGCAKSTATVRAPSSLRFRYKTALCSTTFHRPPRRSDETACVYPIYRTDDRSEPANARRGQRRRIDGCGAGSSTDAPGDSARTTLRRSSFYAAVPERGYMSCRELTGLWPVSPVTSVRVRYGPAGVTSRSSFPITVTRKRSRTAAIPRRRRRVMRGPGNGRGTKRANRVERVPPMRSGGAARSSGRQQGISATVPGLLGDCDGDTGRGSDRCAFSREPPANVALAAFVDSNYKTRGWPARVRFTGAVSVASCDVPMVRRPWTVSGGCCSRPRDFRRRLASRTSSADGKLSSNYELG
jgi:hypothetical protein